jgi:hypothetical protein
LKGLEQMTTAILDPVPEGSGYTVRFSNRVGSTGVVLVVLGWVPKQGESVPDPRQMTVAPGASGELTGTVPDFARARRMVIVASLDAGESGRLELLVEGRLPSNRSISKTTTWQMLVEVAEQ